MSRFVVVLDEPEGAGGCFRVVDTLPGTVLPPLHFETDDCCRVLAKSQEESVRTLVRVLNQAWENCPECFP